jgi:iron complex transport system permease protein
VTVIADPPRAAQAAPHVTLAPERLPIRGRAIRTGWFSVRLDPRAIAVCTVLAIGIVIVGCWSISVGDFPIPMSDVIATLFGNPTVDSEFIVGTLRLPRVLVAIGVGAAFGMSGAIFQSLVRNPLGSPDIIGFNSGAALGAVVMIVSVGGSSTQVAMGAIAGGFIAAVLVYLLAWKRGVQAYRLVLVGIGAGFAIEAFIDFLITRAKITDVQRAAVWLTGSLNGRSWEHVRVVWLAMLVLGPIAIVMQRSLDRLELGDDMAAALGLRVSRSKLALVCVGVALAALGVAAAGPIAFVAFVAGPIARRLVRSPGACIVPAAFVGALVVVVADLAARRVMAPTELPVGIMTAVIGAPYLLWLLTRQARTGAL